MPTLTITYNTPEERRNYETAIAFVSEMHQLGLEAPHGGVIDACEGLALSKGHDFLRETLAGAIEARVSHLEKKANRPVGTQPETRDGGRVRS